MLSAAIPVVAILVAATGDITDLVFSELFSGTLFKASPAFWFIQRVALVQRAFSLFLREEGLTHLEIAHGKVSLIGKIMEVKHDEKSDAQYT